MKPALVIIFIICLFSSCKKDHKPREITQIAIQEFTMDSTSIRAIKAISKDTLYFAGSMGDIGITVDGGKNWQIKNARYQDSIIPHFRSIAFNGKDIFALSIANPALLYKFSGNKTTLVYEENHEKVFYDSMKFFADGKHGIAIGDPTNGCPSIILTSDSGNSWTKRGKFLKLRLFKETVRKVSIQ